MSSLELEDGEKFPEVIRNHFWVFGFEIYESCIDVEMFLGEHRALYFALAILILLTQL